jgi:ABC-type Fe3+ transport system permease subunit
MSGMAEIGLSMTLLRSLIVGVLAVAAARLIQTLLADRRRPIRRAAWILLLAPFFTPVLLTGYAYANFSLSLIHHPVINTIFYSALLWWKYTPIAAVILHFTPAPISAEAVHCRRLVSTVGLRCCAASDDQQVVPTMASKWNDWAFLIRAGCAKGPVAAFAVVFLCAFAEFEMASLMVVKSWTVALFDSHAGGLALSESLRRMPGPLLCEAGAIATAFAVLGRRQVIPARRITGSRSRQWFGWCHLLFAFIFVLMIPAAMVLWGTIRGFGLLMENFVLSREILASLLFAAGASTLAGLAVFGLGAAAGGQQFGSILCKMILIAGVFAGLLGSLVVSLTVLTAVQLPGLIALRDTPAPLVFTLGLVLLPMALVLKRVLELTGHRSALHLTTLMQKSRAVRELIWRLNTSGKFWAMVLLFTWAYWDLTASSILAPIGMTPVTVRLYNLMHYGQIAALSAMTCSAFAAPILIFLLALGTRRWWAPR